MSSNSEEAPIGRRKFAAPKGVAVKRVATGVGAAVPRLAPTVAPSAAPARNLSMAQIRKRPAAPSVPPAPAPAPADADPLAETESESEKAGPALVVSELPAADAAEAASEVAAIKQIIAGKRGSRQKEIPLPADAPLMPADEFKGAIDLKKRIQGVDPVQAKPDADGYRPITSAAFPDFVVKVYRRYSPYLMRVLKEGKEAAAIPKELDKDACKKRNPNKVETFYYQNFVRDFLSRGSPYRGLLVYHGLGTGKTCTSIAAAEALYWGGQKKIFVLTPATLSNNYRKDLGKCGYFPLRQNNFWAFLKLPATDKPANTPAYVWLTSALGLPPALVIAQGGGWIPNPDKPSNWESLSPESKEAVRAQQSAHLNFRFKFIHYNGVTPTVLSQLAASGVAEGTSMFDDAVVVIDEIHNLVRTINGTMIGGNPMSQIIQKVEPREPTWSTPLGRERPGFRYPRGYSLYRLLQNAVGAKIIALSATPMINYAQELAVLLNLIGGEQRMLEISLKSLGRDPATLKQLEEWAKKRPDIDFYSIEEGENRATVLNVTPVPFGFTKVVSDDYSNRGFVRMPGAGSVKDSRERNMDMWAVTLLKDMEATGLFRTVKAKAVVAEGEAEATEGEGKEVTGIAFEAETAVAAARAKGPGYALTPISPIFKLHTFPMLPEDAKEFVANFIDRNTLQILNTNVLKARATGLISYYRGGSEELMPRTGRNEVVRIPMSEYMFKEYSVARMAELDMETPPEKDDEAAGAASKGQKGMTRAEVDLYTQATKSQQTGFLALSRAACNWVFPEEVPRPKISVKDKVKLLGAEQNKLIDADLTEEQDQEMDAAAIAAEPGDEPTDAVLPDAPPPAAPTPLDATLAGILGSLMSGLESKAEAYLNAGLPTYSPKYAAILTNIRESSGPVLVYSQFKTLEGLGIFAAALRSAPERYLPLDIQRGVDGQWAIPDAIMAEMGRPRYILYTGDQELEKRRLLLQLYNADLAALPPRLAEQCKTLLDSAEDNRDGRVCRVFMITQSGAEGISLFNTRQVHIMEPYWNNVRLQQVIGRAIRLCSHMNLPWEDRVVDVFTYISVFSDQQKAEGAKTIMMIDKSMTTDEMIYDIAVKKQKLADGLFEIAQTAATDCQIHYQEHGAVTQCYKFAADSRPMFMYHPDWKKDLQASVRGAGGGAGV